MGAVDLDQRCIFQRVVALHTAVQELV